MTLSRRKRKRARQQAARGDRSPFASGILGEGCAQPGKQNLQLILRAIRQGWPVLPDKRPALVEHLTGILEAGAPDEGIMASRILVAMDEANEREG